MSQTSNPKSEIPKAYEPAFVESKWYKFWLDKGLFTPKIDPAKEPFTIIMPPPNVTGDLHIGHALTDFMEDMMIRWHRMRGDSALWLPGTDHAGIAAQVVVERLLAREGKTRHDLGREAFEKMVMEWAVQCRANIKEQHFRLGASCDWSRERFTMDAGPSLAVRTAFVNLYEKGLIYKGERIINWCPRCATALSDLEVDHQEFCGELYYIRYKMVGEDGFVTVATTRPETLLGDTAVAVNPDDARYKTLTGKKAVIPFVNRIVPIIADSAIDPAFGTGALKVTPAHDPVDFEIGGRHKLPSVNVMNSDGTMNENAGPYKGLDRAECRKQIVADLQKNGQLEKTEKYTHAIGHCDRCQVVIEPAVSEQWFVKTAPLAKRAIEVVRSGEIKIIPERFTKTYLDWLENIRDWCISRQLWWGHRIPVWYCKDCGEAIASVETAESCPKCKGRNLQQDPDVLDTWFSSVLWPHSTLGWPKETEDFRYFYPTSVMETGYDIIFFWVARMVMMGLEDTGKIPFRVIYLHGLVRDEKGEKMSKMKGNVVNPIDTVGKYGADALRFALTTGAAPGNDIKLSPARLEAGRNFANKLWNAARFVIGNIKSDVSIDADYSRLPEEDRWILSRLTAAVSSVNDLMGRYEFGEAQQLLYDFLWGEYCDWYIEMSKIRLRASDKISPLPVLVHVLEVSLRLLHPFMPFVTEELWQNLTQGKAETESIMIAPYPTGEKSKFSDAEAEKTIASVIDIVHAIRNARAEYHVESVKWVSTRIYSGQITDKIEPYAEVIGNLARVKPVTFFRERRSGDKEKNTLVLLLKDADVVIPLESMVDISAEKERLNKEITGAQSELDRLSVRLSDSAFLNKAPAAVVAREKEKLSTLTDKVTRLKEELGRLS